jgi:hypothetical protein
MKREARGKPHNLLGMWGLGEAAIVGDSASLLAVVKEKGSAYGSLGKPLLIAVNFWSGFNNDFETVNALYGTLAIRVAGDPNSPVEPFRNPNGYWGVAPAWIHTHVGGVLVGTNISAWNVARSAPTLWRRPMPVGNIEPLPAWRTADLLGSAVDQRDGTQPVSEMLGLSSDWPLGVPFPH